MHSTVKRNIICAAVCATAASLCLSPAHAITTVTKTFQEGVGGYSGEFTRQFTSNYFNASDVLQNTGNGAATPGTQLFVDGYGDNSPDQQVFIQFNNLFGGALHQIPAGAFIIDATLTLTTGTSANSQSGGPFGVGGVLVPWSASSTYNSLKPAGSAHNGLSAANGSVTPAVGFYDNPAVLYGGSNGLQSATTAGSVGIYRYSANVAPLVRAWSAGTTPNYGFNIHAGVPAATTDGWQVKTGTHATVGDRPLLNVTYTTAPVQTKSFQQGVNGYTGTSMSWVRLEYDITQDGAGINNAFLDGWQYNNDVDDISSDDHALIKFTNLFEGQGGDIPKTARILKATLVLSTSTVGNAQTGQPFQAHQMLRDWNTSNTWSDFSVMYGPNDPSVAGPMLSAQYGMIPGSEAQFDITQAVANWQSGQPNYGIDIRATPPNPMWTASNGTNDGWSIYFTGATDPSLRPELLIHYVLRMPGDANENGVIDLDDFALTDRGFRMNRTGWENGDFNADGVVDAKDYLLLDAAYADQLNAPLSAGFLASREAMFGAGYTAALIAAVPEPASLAVVAMASLALGRRRRA